MKKKPEAKQCWLVGRKSTTFCLFLYCVLQVDPGLGRHCASARWLAGSAARQLDQFPGIKGALKGQPPDFRPRLFFLLWG
jgi:hypothetical protein